MPLRPGILKSLPPAIAVAEDTAVTRAMFSAMVVSDGHRLLVSQEQLGNAPKQYGHTHSTIGKQSSISTSATEAGPPCTSPSKSIGDLGRS